MAPRRQGARYRIDSRGLPRGCGNPMRGRASAPTRATRIRGAVRRLSVHQSSHHTSVAGDTGGMAQAKWRQVMSNSEHQGDHGEVERTRLGGRLRDARKYLGLKQEEVAAHLKIPRSALSDIENGQRRVEALELTRLAKLYGQHLSYFTGEDGVRRCPACRCCPYRKASLSVCRRKIVRSSDASLSICKRGRSLRETDHERRLPPRRPERCYGC